MGKRGFAEAGWAKNKHMIECFTALTRRANKNFHLLMDGRLTDIVGEQFGADGVIKGDLVSGRLPTDQTIHIRHCSPLR